MDHAKPASDNTSILRGKPSKHNTKTATTPDDISAGEIGLKEPRSAPLSDPQIMSGTRSKHSSPIKARKDGVKTAVETPTRICPNSNKHVLS